jgi:hypothetical protein
MPLCALALTHTSSALFGEDGQGFFKNITFFLDLLSSLGRVEYPNCLFLFKSYEFSRIITKLIIHNNK